MRWKTTQCTYIIGTWRAATCYHREADEEVDMLSQSRDCTMKNEHGNLLDVPAETDALGVMLVETSCMDCCMYSTAHWTEHRPTGGGVSGSLDS